MFVSVWLSFWRMDVGGGVEVNWPSGRQEKNTGQGWDRVCAAQSIRHNSPWETSSLSGWRTLSYPMQQQVMNLGPARLHNTLFAVGRWGENTHPRFNTLTQTPSKGPLWFARWRVGWRIVVAAATTCGSVPSIVVSSYSLDGQQPFY